MSSPDTSAIHTGKFKSFYITEIATVTDALINISMVKLLVHTEKKSSTYSE